MKIDTIFDKENLFFTSDLHFHHKNTIPYFNRPFGDVEYMNKRLIEEWNKTVPENGTVFMLGDFCFSESKQKWEEIVNQLHGRIYHVRGNHDYYMISEISEKQPESNNRHVIAKLGTQIDILEIKVKDEEMLNEYQEIVMCHYPLLHWNNQIRNSWHLYGHMHGICKHSHPFALDVGIDAVANKFGYAPISYEQIKIHLTNKIFKTQ